MSEENNNTPEVTSTDTAQPAAGETQAPASPEKDDINLALLAHVLVIFTGFVGPLIIWLVKKDDSEYVGAQAKEALNFAITLILGYIAAAILTVILIGILVYVAVGLMNLILPIVAAVKTSKGESYRYPLTLRLLK